MIDHGDVIPMADKYFEDIDISGQIANQIVAWEIVFETVATMIFETIILRGNISTIWIIYIHRVKVKWPSKKKNISEKDWISLTPKWYREVFNKTKTKKTMIKIVF